MINLLWHVLYVLIFVSALCTIYLLCGVIKVLIEDIIKSYYYSKNWEGLISLILLLALALIVITVATLKQTGNL